MLWVLLLFPCHNSSFQESVLSTQLFLPIPFPEVGEDAANPFCRASLPQLLPRDQKECCAGRRKDVLLCVLSRQLAHPRLLGVLLAIAGKPQFI